LKHLSAFLSIAGLALAGTAHGEVVDLLSSGALFNTGVDASGAALAQGSADSHYSFLTSPAGTATPDSAQTQVGGFPIPPWMADDSLSSWIGPNAPHAFGPIGVYDYQTTFDLTGLDATTVVLTGQWATDDDGLTIRVNGANTAFSIPSNNGASFEAWSQFSIDDSTGLFHSGSNTLDFIVQNNDPHDLVNYPTGDNPTGLRVEFASAHALAGTTNVASAPEPGTYSLFGFGIASLFFAGRRRSVTQVLKSVSKYSGGK
jgi:hypothetical protein